MSNKKTTLLCFHLRQKETKKQTNLNVNRNFSIESLNYVFPIVVLAFVKKILFCNQGENLKLTTTKYRFLFRNQTTEIYKINREVNWYIFTFLGASHQFLNTLDTTHSNIHQQQTGWNTPQGFILYLSTNFETRYLLSSCSNQSMDKNFQFSPKFMLKVASNVFRNRWGNLICV